MLVLRLVSGTASRTVRVAGDEVAFGAAPEADVWVSDADWPAHAAGARVEDGRLVVQTAGGLPLSIAPGGRFRLGAVEIEVVSIETPVIPAGLHFGDYDDDAGLASPEPATFALEPDLAAPPPIVAHRPPPTPKPPPPAPPPSPPAPGPPRAAPPSAAPPRPAPANATPPSEPPRSMRRPGARSMSFVAPTFSAAIVEHVRQAPFFVLSAALHALVVLVSMLLLVETTDDETKHGLGAIQASVVPDEDVGERPEDVDTMELFDSFEEAIELFADRPEIDLAAPPEETVADVPREDDVLPEEPRDGRVDPSPIGTNPTSDLFHRRAPKRRPVTPTPAPSNEVTTLNQPITGGVAASQNRRAAEIVRDMIGRGRRADGARLDDVRGDDLLVITGTFDKIGRVLEALRLPYQTKNPYELRELTNFDKHKVIFWNCGDALPTDSMRGVAKRLEEFVRRGGYLFTTDWAIEFVVKPAFPGYVESSGRRRTLPEMIVDIEPARGVADHPLLEGVFLPDVRGRWWIEEIAFDVQIGPRGQGHVETLIVSPMLQDVQGASPIVALTFKHGRGRVLHALGHYFQEAGNVAGAIASHRLAMNFVLERIGHSEPRASVTR